MAVDLSVIADAVVEAFGRNVTVTYTSLGTLDPATGRRSNFISSQTLPAEVSRTSLADSLSGAGLVEEVTARFRTASMASVADTVDTVTIDGISYQAVAVEKTVDGSMVEVRARRKY